MADQASTIPKGWKMTTLGEVAEITSSKRIFAEEYLTSGIPFYRGKEIIEKFNRDEVSTGLFISENKFDEIKKKFGAPEIGEMLLTSVGTLGIPYLVKKNEQFYFKDGNLTWFKNFNGINNTFFYYWIISDLGKEQLASHTIGSTQQALTIFGLKSVSVFLPPLSEQIAIAAVLSSLDNKIELLREQNKTLEVTAQAIFKEWFVNFNFPNAIDKMIDSELGEIPEGWRIGQLGDEVKIVYGKNLPTESLTKSGYAVFGANGQIGFYDKFIYERPQVLVSCRGEASGKVNISLPESFVTNNSLVLEIADDSDLNFCFLKFFSLNNDYTNFVTGSAQPQITIDSLKNCDLLIPKKEVMDLFNITVEPMDKKQLSNFHQIQTLSALRDTLLPKLMKGEIEVKI